MEAAGEELDLSCFISLSSSAAVFSPTVKDRFLERFPNLILTDSIGATESGFTGIRMVAKDDTAMKGGGPTVSPGADTVVLDEDLKVVPPGSGDHRAGGAGRQHPARLLQGRGQDRGHVRHRRRRPPLLGPR